MFTDSYDVDLELEEPLALDDLEVPEEPEVWSLDDFNDLVSGYDMPVYS